MFTQSSTHLYPDVRSGSQRSSFVKNLRQLYSRLARFGSPIRQKEQNMELTLPDSVLHLFLSVVKSFPSHVAVEDGSETLSYSELDFKSSIIAHELRNHGVKPGQTIPFLTSSCVQVVVGVLGILKCGCAYVPIDRDLWPADRVNYVLSRTNMGLIMYTGSDPNIENTTGIRLPLTKDESAEAEANSIHHHIRSDLMCVIFTSGTTNKPKGVRVRQSSVAQFASAPSFNCDIRPEDRVLLVSSIAFDAFTGNLFSTICNGGTAVLANKFNFQERARSCSIIAATPSILEAFDGPTSPDSYPYLHRVVLGGETPSQKLLESWSRANASLWIAYGPTEATCAVLTGEISVDEESGQFHTTRLGQSIRGSTIWLADRDMNPVDEIGGEGEICISGPCLADGYWQDEALTRERFPKCQGRTTYRTGDLGRWALGKNKEQVIEFCGRRDRVVKIHGFLVNLELDVDAAMIKLDPNIAAIFSLIVDEKLCTAVTPSSVDTSALLSSWKEKAPAYMVPVHVFSLDKLPLNPNGKVDPRELHNIMKNAISQVTLEDRTYDSLEDAVLNGLSHFLGIPIALIDRELAPVTLGVHSLAAAKLSSFCRRYGYCVPVEKILTMPSLNNMIEQCSKSTPQIRNFDEISTQLHSSADLISVTPFQKRLILASLEDQSANCVKHMSRYKSEDIPKLRRAWELVAADEPIFRTRFNTDNANPTMYIDDNVAFRWFESTITSDEEMSRILRTIDQQTGLGIAFHVLHFQSSTLPEDECLFIWSAHHALIDGASASLVFKKVDLALMGKHWSPSIPFTIAARDLENMRTQLQKETRMFWEDQQNLFSIAAGELLFPEPKSADGQKAAEYSFRLAFDGAQVQKMAQHALVTSASVFYAAWSLLLSSFTNSDTVVFGAVLSGRNLPFSWTSTIIGPLFNTLPFVTRIDRSEPTAELLQRTHCSIQQLASFHISDVPGTASRFATFLTIQDSGLQRGTTAIKPLQTPQVKELTSVPLTVIIEADWEVRFLYQTDKFTRSNIQNLALIYENLVRSLLGGTKTIGECLANQLPPPIKKNLLKMGHYDWKETKREEIDVTLTNLFCAAAAANADQPALEKGSAIMTYHQLARSAARVANVVQSHTNTGDVVAVLADRSMNWIVGVISMLIANVIYCPLDANYTKEYRSQLLARAGAKLLLLPKSSQMNDIEAGGPLAVAIDQILESKVAPLPNPWRRQRSSDGAYICFTSGSTGVPKGVICEHRGVVAIQSIEESRFRSKPGQRIAQFLAPGFDCGIHEIYSALCYGGTLVLRKDDMDPYAHLDSVDTALILPSVLAELDPADYPNIKLLYSAGEPLTQTIADKWSVGRDMYNAYGPTEATIFITRERIEPGKLVTVGKPVPTARVYILNDHLELVPPNVFGHVFVAGIQLSRGYLNTPEATANAFVRDPFVPWDKEELMYRTGDIGYWNEDGTLCVLGRKDRQVKVSGYRVNLDDIANAALRCDPKVRKAVAVKSNHRIVLWAEPGDIDADRLQRALRTTLPPHAVPKDIYVEDCLPRNTAGKLDLRALEARVPEPRLEKAASTMSRELSDVIWEEWRSIAGINRTDSGSHEDELLQGNSLSLLVFASRLRSRLGVQVTVKDIIFSTTINEVVALVKSRKAASQSSANSPREERIKPLGKERLSSAEAIWVHRYLNSESRTSFNVPFLAKLPFNINLPKLESAVTTVLNRHAVLRSKFVVQDSTVRRVISETPIEVRTVPSMNEKHLVNQEFNLQRGELVSAVISPSHFLLNISHVVCDLTAMEQLLQEIASVYNGLELPPMTREYFDVTVWDQPVEPEKLKFWSSYLDGLQVGRRPQDRRSYRGTSLLTEVPDYLFHKLVSKATDGGFTLHQFGLTVTGLVLHVLCERDDIMLGSPYINRPTVEDQPVIGLFLEPLAIRVNFTNASNDDSMGLIGRVKQSSQSALSHAVPWASLMKHLGLPHPSNAQHIFDCVVTFHDDRQSGNKLPIEGVVPEHIWAEGSKFAMLFEWHAVRDGLKLRIEYDTDHFSHQFVSIVVTLLLDCSRSLLDKQCSHAGLKSRLVELLNRECASVGLDAEEVKGLAKEFLLSV